MLNTNRKIILIIILILGVFVIPNNFIKDIIKNANDLIKYKNTVTTGEITKDNGDGTYDVKIANASSAYPNVETINYDAVFSVGEIVDIIFEHGCKESPKIIGHSKKIKQEPLKVEVDYSGGCAGVQTVTVTINSAMEANQICGFMHGIDTNYNKCHNSVDGSDLFYFELDYSANIVVGEYYSVGEYGIYRGYVFLDTSSIPINANITNAILSIYFDQYGGDLDFNIVIQDGQPNFSHNPIIASDYDYSKYHNNGGQINTSEILSDNY